MIQGWLQWRRHLKSRQGLASTLSLQLTHSVRASGGSQRGFPGSRLGHRHGGRRAAAAGSHRGYPRLLSLGREVVC